jgi:hypothetical protein
LVNDIPNTTLTQRDTGKTVTNEQGVTQTITEITIKCDAGFYSFTDWANDLNQKFTYNDDLTIGKQEIRTSINNLNVGWTFSGQTQALPTVTNNIQHTTYKIHKAQQDINITVVVVTARAGFQFDTPPTCKYTESFGGVTTATAVISTDKSKATFTIDDAYNKRNNFIINGEVVEGTPTITITNNIEGTNATYTYDNGTFNITLNGTKSGYIIQAANVTYTDTGGTSHTEDMNIRSSDTATISITNVDTSVSVVINGTYIKAIHVRNTLYNCTAENIPTYYTPTDQVNVTIHANEGSKFTSETDPPEIRYTDDFGGVQYKRFTISDDGKQGSVTLDIATECPKTQYIEFRGGAQVDVTPTIKNYGSINVYVVTLENLDAFSKKRYFTESGTFINYEQDLSEYVNRIKRIYTHIPTKGTDRIKCGNYDTEINADLPEKDIITLDFGTITIPRKDNTTLDKDMIIDVFLPFVGIVSLSSDYVGKSVTLVYDINVISGDGVCKLLDNNDLPIQLHNVQPNTDILYTTYDTSVIGSDRWDAQNLYGLEPFVRLHYFTNEYSGGRGNDYKKVVLSQCSKGFYKFDEIVNNDIDNVPKSEYNEIVNLLHSGVFID